MKKNTRDTVVMLTMFAVLGAAALSAVGCQHNDRYHVQLRDAQTGEPISGASLTSRYGAQEELIGDWIEGGVTTHRTQTVRDGTASVTVTPGHVWWLEIESPDRPVHCIEFDADGFLREPDSYEVRDGWIRTKLFGGRHDGTTKVFGGLPDGTLDARVVRAEPPK